MSKSMRPAISLNIVMMPSYITHRIAIPTIFSSHQKTFLSSLGGMARQDYRDLTKEQLIALLEARDRKKLGLVWERDAIEQDRALNADFVALEEVPELSMGAGTRENLIIEGDNFDDLRPAHRLRRAGQVHLHRSALQYRQSRLRL